MRFPHANERSVQDLWVLSPYARNGETRSSLDAGGSCPVEPRYPAAVRLAILIGGSALSWSMLFYFLDWLL